MYVHICICMYMQVEMAERGPGIIKKTEGLIQQLVAVSFAMMVPPRTLARMLARAHPV